jgi:hypothetical protein
LGVVIAVALEKPGQPLPARVVLLAADQLSGHCVNAIALAVHGKKLIVAVLLQTADLRLSAAGSQFAAQSFCLCCWKFAGPAFASYPDDCGCRHDSAPCQFASVVRPLRPTGGVLHISVECQTGIQTILEDF